MNLFNRNLGCRGEDIASKLLQEKGYDIIERNHHSRWGEIDIIARKDKKLAFIEVKTRTGFSKGKPHEAIDFFKKRSLRRSVQYYLLQKNWKDYKLSIDMISVLVDQVGIVKSVIHYENIDTI